MTYKIHNGNALDVLRLLDSKSVQCCVTSPPYFGLRDYGTGEWSGGAPDCDHLRGNSSWVNGESRAAGPKQIQKVECRKCGAIRMDSQIGLENSPQEYVAQLVEVFREVKRVLKDDGTLWVNIGDSYADDSKWGGTTSGEHSKALDGKTGLGRAKVKTGLKPRDLIGIPWRLAFALQDDGWYLRQDIIWAKPNPMPESVTSRCTKAHEYVFLLSKRPKYYFDHEAIKEPAVSGHTPKNRTHKHATAYEDGAQEHRTKAGLVEYANKQRDRSLPRNRNGITGSLDEHESDERHKRDVWTVATEKFEDAHFAVMPPKLAEPMILAGSRVGDAVLDPFNGAATTGLVALQNGRQYVGIELNPDYIEISKKRLSAVQVKLFL